VCCCCRGQVRSTTEQHRASVARRRGNGSFASFHFVRCGADGTIRGCVGWWQWWRRLPWHEEFEGLMSQSQ
jgi:hypothetical protein